MAKISKQSKVTFVELPPTQYGVYNGEQVHDVYTRSKMPSRSIHSLEAVLRAGGYTNTEAINPIYHGKHGKLTPENEAIIYSSDILCISSITRTSPQSMELSRRFKLRNPDKTVIVGGVDPTYRAEEWLTASSADIVVCGEGEKTLYELMQQLISDPQEIAHIPGIAFKVGTDAEFTKPRTLLTEDELSQLPHPHYDKKTRKGVNIAAIETSRGCPYGCDFCCVTQFYGNSYRNKSPSHVIDGLRNIRAMGPLRFFTDDNLAGNPKYTIALLEAIAEQGLIRKNSSAQVPIITAYNPRILEAMKKAGISILFVGIESIVDETLKGYKKHFTAKQNIEGIKILREAGFWVHGMMMLGGDGDTPENLRETSEWVNNNVDSVQLFTPTPFPGTPFFKRMEEQSRILTKDYSLYDAQNVVIRPKHFTPIGLQQTIYDMYQSFYSMGQLTRRLKTSPLKKVTLGLMAYLYLLGARQDFLYSPNVLSHLEFLKSVS